MPVRICKRFTFESAHRLPFHTGKCQNLHGHSYKLDVEVKGVASDVSGMVMDFAELKELVTPLIEKIDHQLLNDHFDNPTAELMVSKIALALNKRLSKHNNGVFSPFEKSVCRVRLWETDTCYAEWREEDQRF